MEAFWWSITRSVAIQLKVMASMSMTILLGLRLRLKMSRRRAPAQRAENGRSYGWGAFSARRSNETTLAPHLQDSATASVVN